jgi:hypothetical protein
MLSLANLASKRNPSRAEGDKFTMTGACCQATSWHRIGGPPEPDDLRDKALYEKCLKPEFTSEEWYQFCDKLFVHDTGGKARVEQLEKSLRYGG